MIHAWILFHLAFFPYGLFHLSVLFLWQSSLYGPYKNSPSAWFLDCEV